MLWKARYVHGLEQSKKNSIIIVLTHYVMLSCQRYGRLEYPGLYAGPSTMIRLPTELLCLSEIAF